MVIAAIWTVIGILGAALAAFFVDSRTERRTLVGRIDGVAADLRADLGGRIDALGGRIDAVATDLGGRIDAQTERIDRLVFEFAHHTHDAV
ncbi:MAG TPA: hypothetical protein VEG62_07155 [Acidimicrobiales bacterium]|nr:hypothetical protein [Acidimicrobiales bacterium]